MTRHENRRRGRGRLAAGLLVLALAPAAVPIAAGAAPAAGPAARGGPAAWTPPAGLSAHSQAAHDDEVGFSGARVAAGQGTATAPLADHSVGAGGATTAGGVVPLATPAAAGQLFGPDVASWQHPGGAGIGWGTVKAKGASFAIVKATEGTGYTNPYFAKDTAAARAAGLKVGAYHYARPSWPASKAATEARYFLKVVGTTRTANTLAPILDLEETGGLSPSQLAAWTSTFLRTIENVTGRAPYVYSYPSFIRNALGNTAAFRNYPLWIASYSGTGSPGALPGGWSSYRLWQYTSSATLGGIPGKVDLSVFCCSAGTLGTVASGMTEIALRYAGDGAARAVLGAATGSEGAATGGGRWQRYQGGGMTWSVATGAHTVHGGIGVKYLSFGGSGSALGLPLRDQETIPSGWQQVFQGGRIFSIWGLGTHEVQGGILARYLALGGTNSALGGPTSDEHAVAGGRASTFQHGTISWNATTHAITVTGG